MKNVTSQPVDYVHNVNFCNIHCVSLQECIPVGCVPSAAEAVYWAGGGGSATVHAGIPPGLGLDPPGPGPGHTPLWIE